MLTATGPHAAQLHQAVLATALPPFQTALSVWQQQLLPHCFQPQLYAAIRCSALAAPAAACGHGRLLPPCLKAQPTN